VGDTDLIYDNSYGDPVAYTATFVNSTSLTLDRPYEGTTGTHGWELSDFDALGWVSQPFMVGILSTAFDLAAKAVADTSPTTAALSHSYSVAAANWLKNVGYWPSSKAMYYFAGGIDCVAPITDGNGWCTYGNDAAAARTLSAEAIRGVMAAYAYNRDPALKAFADTLHNAMWGRTSTCPGGSTLCVPDGVYLTGMDDGGYMISGGPPTNEYTPWKWFGQFYGWSGLSSWPGYRNGGIQGIAVQSVGSGMVGNGVQ
jgi:hypothetical protein